MSSPPTSGATCAACDHGNRPGARFCSHCGAALPRSCAACGRVLAADARFCDACGRPADTAAAQPGTAAAAAPSPAGPGADPAAYTPPHLAQRILHQRAALEGERKHVTVLFADLEGSTAWGESADPEEIHRTMDEAFQLMLTEVHRYEGTVNQFTGDGIMALFGAPVALEDGPVRAVRAALGIQRALAPIHERQMAQGRSFRMRIGIHTGLVVVGKIGDDLRMDYTALGDTTNLASRLEQLAPPGGIVISDATRRLCLGFFDLKSLGEQAVKGRRDGVDAFEVTGDRPVASRLDALASVGLTPLVGRDRELSELDRAFEDAREGRGRVVLIAGDAGIGKSRLLHEFRQRHEEEPHVWFEGRCSTYTQTTAFHPISDGLRRAFGIRERDADTDALAKVDDTCQRLDLPGAPILRSLLSLPSGDDAVEQMDPVTRRSETVGALQRLMDHLTETRPLVLVVEDLHWIDPASEDFLAMLAERAPTHRLLMLLTHRPGYEHPFGDRSFHSRLAVQTLSEAEMGDMARGVLESPGLPETLRRRIAEKAEGNPLFVEEVTHSLLEEGIVLRGPDGVASFRAGIEDVSIPDRIQDVLMARIDRLEEEPKRAIQCASVIGREFALRLLQHTSELGDEMGEVVDDLRSLELIYEKSRHPELAFMFKHALTRDVAYQSVLVERRARMHRAVGAAIEQLYSDRLGEYYGTLADHFTLGEDWSQAFHYHELASIKAAATYANQSAAEHCRQALAAAEHLGAEVPAEARGALENRLGAAEYALSAFVASGDAYLRSAACTSDPAHQAMNLSRGAYALLWGHDYERAKSTAESAVALAETHDLPAARALAAASLDEQAIVIRGLNAETQIETGLAAAERSGDAEAICMVYSQIAQRAEMAGQFPKAIDFATRAIEAARSQQLEAMVTMAQWMRGLALTCTGQYGPAIGQFRDALELCDRLGDRAVRGRTLNTLGFCHAEIGCHAEAATYNRSGTQLGAEMVELGLVPGAPELYANGAVNLVGNHIALGEFDEAREHLEPLQRHLAEDGDPWMRWRYAMHVSDALARLHLAEEDPERAVEEARGEVAVAREHGARKIEARALELQGRALLATDRREEARETLESALRLARELGYPPVLWRALSLLAELSRRAGDRSGADRQAQEGRDLVESLARPLKDSSLQQRFGGLGEALVDDPLGAYR